MSAGYLLERPAVFPASLTVAEVLGVSTARGDVASKPPACLPVYRGGKIIAYALIDRDLAQRVGRYRWHLDPAGYAYSRTAAGEIKLHRYVMGLRVAEPLVVHHRNAEKLDCRRANLEILTAAGHAIAHGMRPRSPIYASDDSTSQSRDALACHPALDRGLEAWLSEVRRTSPLPGVEETLMAMRGGRPKSLPGVLTPEEAEALMKMPNLKCPTGLRDRAVMMVMHRCGLRVSEACGLHLRDVKWSEKKLHLRAEITKGGREGVAYLDSQTRDMLERWVEVRRRYAAGQPWLFVTLHGGPVDRRAVFEMVRRRARKAGIESHVSPHILRHTYATDLLREGFSLREVQHLLRHADIRTTVLYTHLFDADLAQKIAER